MSPLTRASVLAALLSMSIAQADDGDPDPSFSTDGKTWFSWPISLVQSETTAVTSFADGSVVTAGWVDNGNNNRDFALVRFRSNGELDTDFGDLGSKIVAFDLTAGADDRAVGVFALADGKTLVVGKAGVNAAPYTWPALLRLTGAGQPDPSFGVGGKQVVLTHPWGSGANFNFTAAAQQPDGKIVLAGACSNCPQGGVPDFMAVRLLASGGIDTGFGNQGWVSFGRIEDNRYLDEQVRSVVVEDTGRIVLTGYSEHTDDPDERQTPLIVRFSAAGVLDTGFGTDGYVLLNLPGSWSADVAAAAVRRLIFGIVDRRLFLALNVSFDPAISPASILVALNPDGALIDSFGVDGLVSLTREEGTQITALAVRSDMRVTAAGWIDPTGPTEYDFFHARTLFDGTLDTSFDGNGVARVAFDVGANSYDRPYAISLSAQRPVIAGTIYSVVGATFHTGVLRLQSDRIFADGLQY